MVVPQASSSPRKRATPSASISTDSTDSTWDLNGIRWDAISKAAHVEPPAVSRVVSRRRNNNYASEPSQPQGLYPRLVGGEVDSIDAMYEALYANAPSATGQPYEAWARMKANLVDLPDAVRSDNDMSHDVEFGSFLDSMFNFTDGARPSSPSAVGYIHPGSVCVGVVRDGGGAAGVNLAALVHTEMGHRVVSVALDGSVLEVERWKLTVC